MTELSDPTITYQTNGEPQPGLHEDVPEQEYRRAPGVAKSTLDWLAISPALVEWNARSPRDEEQDAAVDLGNAFEQALLEPERYAANYAVAPQVDRRTKQGKADWEAFMEECEAYGRTPLTRDQGRQVDFMVRSTWAHPMARRVLMADRLVQPSYWAYDDATGLLCKCRPDIMLAENPLVADVKTSGQIERFGNSVADLRYHVQDAYYGDLVTPYYGTRPAFVFIVVSSSLAMSRYPVRVFELTPEDREAGRAEYRRDLDTYVERVERGNWSDVETLTRPAWAWRKDEQKGY